MTRCIRCGVEKSESDFYAHPRMANGHLNKCKACCKTQAKDYREARGAVEARNLRLALARDERLTHEERRARSAVMNAERVKRWHAAHPERVRGNFSRWAERHPERKRELARRGAMHRYAVKRGAQGHATADQIAARWAYYGDRCWICRGPATQTDHVIALNRGGSDWPSNQRPSCSSCNRAKSDKDHRLFTSA